MYEEEYFALYIAIAIGCTPERAFSILAEGRRSTKHWLTDDIKREIIEARKHAKIAEVAATFWLCESQVSRICHEKE